MLAPGWWLSFIPSVLSLGVGWPVALRGEVEVRGGGSLEDYWWRPLTAENTLVEAPLPVGLPSPAQGAHGDGPPLQHRQDAPLTLCIQSEPKYVTMIYRFHEWKNF